MTVADVVRLAFEKALEYAAKRAAAVVPAAVSREDLEAVLIQLRFIEMEISMLEGDLITAEHRLTMDEIRRRFEAERAAGNVPDTTIIEPDGTEPTTRVFERPARGPRKDDE